ncbi:hypothetical protein GCM10012275_38320 [Longimycelium tulufanense]|uniref:Uncharacterized protein n=1 Tax=Longimycelium tulufanense TaxID=907463 RepID=A0A8J3CG68_9PSEU|nr:hypothetical protein [Longimycelium tulufanense]GGM64113.1 hypothetical protein GCM10012275_38320 [Longimycelium tulufanense]
MPRYTVQHAYRAEHNGRRYGPWQPDTEVDLEAEEAEWVNRDSPDTLAPVAPSPPPAPEVEPEPDEPVRAKPAGRDRQHRGGTNRGRW